MRRLAELSFVVLGLYAVLQAITYVFSVASVFTASGLPDWQLLGLGLLSSLPSLVAAGAGVFLIRQRERLSQRFVEDVAFELPVGPTDLLRIGLLIAGVVLVVQAAPSVLSAVVQPFLRFAQERAMSAEWGPATFDVWGGLVRLLITVGQLGLGILITVRAMRLADWLWALGEPCEPKMAATVVPASPFTCASCGTPYDPTEYEGGVSEPRCSMCKEPLDMAAHRTSAST